MMMQELLNLWVNDTDFGADAGAIVALAAAAGSDAGEAEAEEEEEEEGDVTFLRTAKHSARGGPSIPTLRVLDAGCGVGGSSRFLYRTLKEVRVSRSTARFPLSPHTKHIPMTILYIGAIRPG